MKPIPNLEGYFATEDGRIWSEKSNKFLKQSEHKGYLFVKAQGKPRAVHRLILNTFEPNPNADDLTVNHKDENPKNNQRDNLEWLTISENLKKSHQSTKRFELHKGEKNGNSKLTESDVKSIKELIKRNEELEQIARKFGVSKSTIYFIKTGKYWSHV